MAGEPENRGQSAAVSHAAALLRDGEILGAVEEERFVRRKGYGYSHRDRPQDNLINCPDLDLDEVMPRHSVDWLLDEAGLGDFCLTLPSGTANTGRDIARRIERLGHFREPSGTDDPAQAIADGQKELGEHGTRLDSGRNRLGLTPRQILVGALKHREELGNPMPPLRGVDMGDTAALDAPAMARAEIGRASCRERV